MSRIENERGGCLWSAHLANHILLEFVRIFTHNCVVNVVVKWRANLFDTAADGHNKHENAERIPSGKFHMQQKYQFFPR